MKVISKILAMSDNELSKLFTNALELIHNKKMVDSAQQVLEAIEVEWSKRLEAYKDGEYKADTPEKGVLKTLGYRVGNDGVSSEKRKMLIDYLLNQQLPPVGSPAHMAEWGEPSSKQRYRKAHRVIQVLKSSASTLGYMDKAAKEWAEDLDYMEKTWGHLK